MSTPSFELVISIALIAMAVLSIWRFTSIIQELAQSTARHDERNAAQRDRFFMQLLEQKAVASTADQAVRMAAVHSAEDLRKHGMNLQRDAADTQETVKAARHADRERKHRERQGAAPGTPVEAFSK